MISVAEARARIIAAFQPVATEIVGLDQAFGRVLAVDMAARLTQPPVAVSAMDGWALRFADAQAAPAVLQAIGAAHAGQAFAGRLGPGQAVRIFTGAPIPEGADTVLIQEDADLTGDAVRVRSAPAKAGAYVRPAGLDFRAGEVGLKAGRQLSARDIGLAAAMNLPWLGVRRRPRIAVLATGDELVRPGEPIGPSQIVSSNGLAVAALVRAAGAEAIDLGIAADRPEALARMARGAEGADLLVTIGGASVGQHDLVRQVLGGGGASIDFWRIAMRPGKPLMFGRARLGPVAEVPLLGLPGNPVSALVCALIFLIPAIRALQGATVAATPLEPAWLGDELAANDKREDYLRAKLGFDAQGRAIATPFPLQDSSMISFLAAADCFIVRRPLAPPAKTGERVDILRLGPGGF